MNTSSYRLLLDTPSKEPALNFDTYAKALADIIEKSDPQFAVGIFGNWGSGKTTLMEIIEKKLNPEIAVTVPFSAWRYEKENHLIIPLLDTVREGLVKWAEAKHRGASIGRNIAHTIGAITKSVAAGFSFTAGLPGAMEMSFDANKSLAMAEKIDEKTAQAQIPRSFYHASFNALHNAFKQFSGNKTGRRIVVFVDDLDRCLPEGALEVLESMKLFFDIKGFVFVVGIDEGIVEWMIDTRYRQAFQKNNDNFDQSSPLTGKDYIKKIFQLPFNLPPVSRDSLATFLDAVYNEAGMPSLQKNDLKKNVAPHLPYILSDSGVNPREVKRYINSYIIQRKTSHNGSLNPHVILAVNTISFQPDWADVKKYLHSGRDLFLEAIKKRLIGELNPLNYVAPELGDLPQSFRDYVDKDGPGNPLLQVNNISDYIRSGALATTRGGEKIPALFIKISDLGRQLQEEIQNYDFSKSIDLHSLKSEFGSIKSRVESTIGDEQKAKIQSDLGKIVAYIKELVDIRPDPDAEAEPNDVKTKRHENLRQMWLSHSQTLIAEAQNHLSELIS